MKARDAVALFCGLLFGSSGVACNSILGIDAASQGDAAVDAGGGGNADVVTPSYVVDCANYCNLVQAACNGTQLAMGDNTEYLSSDVCMQLCARMDASAEVLSPSIDPTLDDTLNCRVWHANAALQANPHFHCPHAGPLGGTFCDDNHDPCSTFCRLDVQICTGENAAYASYQDCMNACEPDAGYGGYTYALDINDPEVTDLANYEMSNTLNCRMYHLENFLYTQQAIHCSHTSLNGNGVCSGTPPADF
jgi:hypothetical protein